MSQSEHPVRRALLYVLASSLVLVAIALVVFHFGMGLSWIEAIYFVVATVTTVGYGDYNLQDASPGLKLFGCFLMVAGAASMAATFGLVTDLLLEMRIRELLGPGRRRMQNHVVLCGLGNVGFRVLEHLHRLGEPVVVVERSEESKFLESARAMKVPIVIGDVRFGSALEDAFIRDAKCLVAATNDDLANLDAALTARELRPGIRIVLRMFDQALARKIKGAFDIQTAFSTSALAAPAFAMAALDESVVGSFYVGDDLLLNVELAVGQGTSLAGMTTADLDREGEAHVVLHTVVQTGERRLHPTEPRQLEPGDRLVVSLTPDFLPRLQALNRATA